MTQNRRLVTVSLLICSTLISCKKPSLQAGRTAYIVGPTNDIVSMRSEKTDEVDADVLSSAVLIVTQTDGDKVKFCSGTLIDSEISGERLRVLSNHHCFAQIGDNQLASETLMVGACTDTKVYLGFLPDQTANAFVSACEPGSLKTNFNGDLSVFTLSSEVPPNFKPVSLYDGQDQGIGRRALIVHYPNIEENLETPRGGKVELPTAALTINDCRVLGEFDPIEWSLDRSLPISLRHSCDLIHGSSGSGLIDAETGKLLGVNWGGIKVSYSDRERVDNVATKAKFVEAFLAGRAEEELASVEARLDQASGTNSDKKVGIERRTLALIEGTRAGKCGVIAAANQSNGWSHMVLLLFSSPFLIAAAQWYTNGRRRG